MKRFLPTLVQGMIIALLAFLITCAVSVLSSCRTCRQAESSHEIRYIHSGDSIRNFSLRVDSVNVRDSIFTLVKGDTVRINHWHSEFHEKLRIDTLRILRSKTFYITRTERISVARKIPPWYSPGNLAKIILSAIAGYFIGRFLSKLLSKFRQRK